MKKLTIRQQKLLECALDKLYAFISCEYKVEYGGNILCIVYNDVIRLNQCSCPDGVAWFVDIMLKERKLNVTTREVERDIISTEGEYDLFYMGSKTTTHTIDF